MESRVSDDEKRAVGILFALASVVTLLIVIEPVSAFVLEILLALIP